MSLQPKLLPQPVPGYLHAPLGNAHQVGDFLRVHFEPQERFLL